jgi:ABC-2 type transport system ATP-binding protein
MNATITVRGLTKRYGTVTAVDALTFDVAPGLVTAFLGPNGAGKTTTLRMLLGLVTPTEGEALIGVRRYADLINPRRTVGAVLEATGFHPGRTGRDHLRVIAQGAGLPAKGVTGALDRVGLTAAADRRVRGYSLGMRQRLGLAAALLGDPQVLVLDEPANGLDPGGIVEMRGLIRSFADDGITVLVSSHLISEIEQICDYIVMIRAGKLVHQGAVADLRADQHPDYLLAPEHDEDTQQLAKVLEAAGCTVTTSPGDATIRVEASDRSAADLNRLAANNGITLRQLAERTRSLERAFFALTGTGTDEEAGVRSGQEMGAIR